MAQIKFVLDDALVEQFKRAVLKKHGKLALSEEGAHALRLYLRQASIVPPEPQLDPLLAAIGLATSTGSRPNALRDKRDLHGA